MTLFRTTLYKSVHSFIDVSDHLEKVKGLIGEINRHTNKYNKIPWDKEEKWATADWIKLWKKISSNVFKMSGNMGVSTYFTTDRTRTIGCLKYRMVLQKFDKPKKQVGQKMVICPKQDMLENHFVYRKDGE